MTQPRSAPPKISRDERRHFEGIAREAVQNTNPGVAVRTVEVRAVLRRFVVVAVHHGVGRPSPRTYVRVRRSDLDVRLEPERRWWPRGSK